LEPFGTRAMVLRDPYNLMFRDALERYQYTQSNSIPNRIENNDSYCRMERMLADQ